MAKEQITKKDLAEALGISRPTLDTYLKEGFPSKITDPIKKAGNDSEYQRIILENELRIVEYKIKKLEETRDELKEELSKIIA